MENEGGGVRWWCALSATTLQVSSKAATLPTTIDELHQMSDIRALHCATPSHVRLSCPAGRVLPQLFVPSVTSFEWSADSSCLYYTTPDETGRPSQVRTRVAFYCIRHGQHPPNCTH